MNVSILPIRRNLKFNLNPAKALTWHKDGLNVSQFLNTMSLFFPVGERFFIDSVRKYRDQITDPDLQKAVTAFIGQEAMHGREHDEYNGFVADAGIPLHAQEAAVGKLLQAVQDYTPDAFQLAATVALEHLTAILGGGLLDLPEIMEGSDEGYKAIWNWHALEETEHKAVAFDVYTTVIGDDSNVGAYALRTSTLVAATGIFFALMIPFYVHNVRIKGGLFDLKGWAAVAKHTWGRKGIFLNITKPWLDWFKPGFHPWDHDNREQLENFEKLLGDILRDAA
ncbi:metal-dependent hydrolase [Alcanivorax sp. S6407]|uniref:metal-dependent hydrolase n=1 Tax=Alcanivorax sp. S6407 TaxID=2926424 RepID=UPI001FF109B8|nr:metal-dependent hydrolase [Alcanivorax sp. S6407]MCK0154839.1 metal-dependent hydrolase [Alcanivorax sp. S6407]